MIQRRILSLEMATCLAACLLFPACGISPVSPLSENSQPTLSVGETPSQAQSPDGLYISWREHLIDDEQTNGGIPIRGGDGLAMADLDQDGYLDIVSVHEDSGHLRVAFGTADPHVWINVTLAEGDEVAAIEDVAIGDLNGDGWPDLVAACEEAHLLYLQNPGKNIRTAKWPRLIPEITQGRGSWLRVFIADMDQDGRPDILAANKGAADIIDPSAPTPARPTSLFLLSGYPLQQASWREQILSMEVVPNTAMPVDIDNDGDLDVLTAARLHLEMTLLEVIETRPGEGIIVEPRSIHIVPGFPAPADWKGASSAFQSVFADLDHDGRPDLIVAVHETPADSYGTPLVAGVGWLRQPDNLLDPWTYHRIGDTLPDIIAGIALADINGDGHPDIITGGYSGLNILGGAYSGASREEDDPRATAASTSGRIAWFENPGDATHPWKRHDITRNVRGMYDGFIPHDVNGDGYVDLISTRGNSGRYDGVFWLEQVRTAHPHPAFTPARNEDSRALPLPPENWVELYETGNTYVPPNKTETE